MGKGGCLGRVLEEGLECARAIIGCACFIVLIGPILFIVGLVMLLAPNTRQQDVNTYNSAVSAWTSSGNARMMTMANISGPAWPVGRVPLQPASMSVVVDGNTDGVQAATSNYLQGTVSLSAFASQWTLVWTPGTSTPSSILVSGP